MPTMPIAVVQPPGGGGRAMGQTGERRAVRALAEYGANEPLGLAVHPAQVGAGAAVHEARGLHGGAEDGRGVAGPVVGEHGAQAHSISVLFGLVIMASGIAGRIP
jgi:hypothetical protein